MFKWLQDILLFAFSTIVVSTSHAAAFKCEAALPEQLQVSMEIPDCTQTVGPISPQAEPYTTTRTWFYKNVARRNNLGASWFSFPDGSKRIIFRSANLGGSPTCLKNLVSQGKIISLINLYNGTLADALKMTAIEKKKFYADAGKNYHSVLNFSVAKGIVNENFYNQIAGIVKTITNNQGNILIHCLIGAHDTGVIFGVMQKCYNKVEMPAIIKDTQCHAPTASAVDRQFLAKTISIIKNFPCALLQDTKNQ